MFSPLKKAPVHNNSAIGAQAASQRPCAQAVPKPTALGKLPLRGSDLGVPLSAPSELIVLGDTSVRRKEDGSRDSLQ